MERVIPDTRDIDHEDEPISELDLIVGSIGFKVQKPLGVLQTDLHYLREHDPECTAYKRLLPEYKRESTHTSLWLELFQIAKEQAPLNPFEALAAKEELLMTKRASMPPAEPKLDLDAFERDIERGIYQVTPIG